MTDNMTETPTDDGGATPPRPVARRTPRRMRYAQRAAGIPVPDDGDTADTGGSGGDLGLAPQEWATAAETMAQEAAQAQDSTDTGDSTDEAAQPQWGDAFTPAQPDDLELSRNHSVDPGAEPGRYRERLSAAEAEAEQLRGLVESMRAAEVERLATGTGRLADASDLYRDGVTVADLLGDNGRVDPAKVDGAIDAVLSSHPHWRARVAPYRGRLASGATSVQFDKPTKKFADAFRPNHE